MRTTCVRCALKHLGQARALLLEARKGYPCSYWYALGHMAEAEDELVMDHEALANTIRDERKKLEPDPLYMPDFDRLVTSVSEATGYDVSEILGGAQ